MDGQPYVRLRADFIGDNYIAEHNDAGIIVTREGNVYRFGVELDVDSVVVVDSTTDKHQVNNIINSLLPMLPEIRDRYGNYYEDEHRHSGDEINLPMSNHDIEV